MKPIVILLIALALTACASTDYKFGDISKKYCAATTPEGRAILKKGLEATGVVVPVDYCASVNLVDALVSSS